MAPPDKGKGRLLALLKRNNSDVKSNNSKLKSASTGANQPKDTPAYSGAVNLSGSYSTTKHNNWFNIRPSKQYTWQGQIGTLGGFIVFDKPEHSLRAFFKTIYNGYLSKGYNTVEKIINRYAPKGDGSNDPERYISSVIAITKKDGKSISRSTVLTKQDLPYLAKAMLQVESGVVKPMDWFTTNFNKFM